MRASLIKLLLLILLVCLSCTVVGCTITNPTTSTSESETISSESTATESEPESSEPEIQIEYINESYETASKTFKLELIENNSGYRVLGFSSSWDSTQEFIAIPDFIDGLPVTEIADSAFYNSVLSSAFYLPNTLTYLGDYSMPDKASNMVTKNGISYIGSKDNPYIVALKCKSESITSIKFEKGCYFIYSFFKGSNNKISQISFPSTLLQIGEWSFTYSDIKELKFNEGLLKIGDYAFDGCDLLTSIALPSTLKEIGRSAFTGCTQITEINIPKSLQEIGSDAFLGNTLSQITVDSENKYFSSLGGVLYNKDVTTLILFPKALEITEFSIPVGVQEICYRAFYGSLFVEKLIIPSTVTTIGSSAFNGMKSLKYISFPNSVVDVGYLSFPTDNGFEFNEKDGALYIGNEENPYAYLVQFKGNGSGSFKIADTCLHVGQNAFYGTSLTELTIPKSVISFGDDVFDHCLIENVIYEGSAIDWCNIDFCSTIHYSFIESPDYGSYSNPLITGADLYINGELLTEMIFPEGTTKINDAVFHGYSKLTRIVIPQSVTEIGDLAFAFCYNLEELELSDNITYIGKWAFIACEKIKDFSLPKELITIEENAFSNCLSLTSIIIPNKVKTIGIEAFFFCKNVIEVVIGENVETIGSSAFRYCGKIVNAISNSPHIFLEKDAHNSGYGYLNSMASFLYNVGDTVTTHYEIVDNAFVTLKNGEEVLLMAYVGESLEVVIPDGITSIYTKAFNYDSITSVIIPDSVTEIKNNAFNYCYDLQSIILSTNLKSIGAYAFYYCISLEEIILNEGLEKIENGAFANSGLTHVEIPDSVTFLGERAFDVTPLKSVKIGSGVKTIEFRTFAYCRNLETVDLGSVETIAEWAFINCSSLKELILPDSVIQINSSCFESCSSLEKIIFGNGLTEIPTEAFKGCTSLKEIVFSDTIEIIGDYAFYQCKSLETLSLTQNIKSLGEHAFAYCTNLTSVTIGVNITSLGYMSFYQCKNLTEVIYNGQIQQWELIYDKGKYIFNFTAVTNVICKNGNFVIVY